MTDKMEYTDKEGKTYVASHSLGQDMESLKLWMKISTTVRVLELVAFILILWWVQKNNFMSQILSVLKMCNYGML